MFVFVTKQFLCVGMDGIGFYQSPSQQATIHRLSLDWYRRGSTTWRRPVLPLQITFLAVTPPAEERREEEGSGIPDRSWAESSPLHAPEGF